MPFDPEKRHAMRMLTSVEDGRLSTPDLRPLFEDADPALVSLIFTWLRTRYRSHPAAEGVLGRIVALCAASPAVARKARAGESDSIVRWFSDTHDFADFDRDAFIDLIVDKLES